MKSILLYPILFLALIIFGGCTKVEQPEFRRLENFGFRDKGLQEIVVGFDATFFNPNHYGLSVKEAAFDLYVDSIYLGKFTQPYHVDVTPGSEFSVPMEGTMSLKKISNFQVNREIDKDVLLQAKGAIKLGKGGIFVTRNISYQGHYNLNGHQLKNPAEAGL